MEFPEVIVELAVGDPDDPWVPTPRDDFRSAQVTQGSSRFDGITVRYDAGKATIVLDASSGDYDPDNLSGPYVAGGETLLTPMRGVRVRSVWDDPDAEPLITGFMNSMPILDDGRDVSTVTISVTDGTKVFANYDGVEQSPHGAGEDTGARVARWADLVGWPAAWRNIDTGDTRLQATTLAGSAWNEILRSVDTEAGEVYFDGWGHLRFRRRRATFSEERSAVSQATFSDRPGGGVLPYSSLVLNYDDDQLRNLIRAGRVGGTVQEVEDVASQTRYSWDGATPMPRTWGRSDLLMETDEEALLYANYVLYQTKDAEQRFEQMIMDPHLDPDALFPQVLGRKLGDRITGVRHRPSGGTETKELFIRGWQHTITVDTWSTNWVLQAADKFSFFVLNSPTLGRLNANRLGY